MIIIHNHTLQSTRRRSRASLVPATMLHPGAGLGHELSLCARSTAAEASRLGNEETTKDKRKTYKLQAIRPDLFITANPFRPQRSSQKARTTQSPSSSTSASEYFFAVVSCRKRIIFRVSTRNNSRTKPVLSNPGPGEVFSVFQIVCHSLFSSKLILGARCSRISKCGRRQISHVSFLPLSDVSGTPCAAERIPSRSSVERTDHFD